MKDATYNTLEDTEIKTMFSPRYPMKLSSTFPLTPSSRRRTLEPNLHLSVVRASDS